MAEKSKIKTYFCAMNRRRMCVFALLCTLAMGVWAQHVNPEDREVDMDNPTFVPMLKVSKVKQGADSLQYVELNRVYVYPQPEFKSEKQKQAYL